MSAPAAASGRDRRRATEALEHHRGHVTDALARHRRHALLAALVGGLLLRGGPLALAAALAAAAACAALRRPRLGAGVALALVLGAACADARIAAIDRAALGPAARAITADATVLEAPRARADGSFHARVRLDPGGVAVAVLRSPPELGAIVRISGRAGPLGPADAYQRLRGARAAVEVTRATPTGRRRGGVAGLLDAARRRAAAALTTGGSPTAGALARGMVLGQDEALPRPTREDFERSGLAHLLAVSGQNVVLLCLLVFGLGGLAGVPFRARILIALATTALYVPLAGGGPSIQRAGVMGAAGLVATLAGRPASRWYALGLAAAATLALNPHAVAEPGWQLSFAAVGGLIAWAVPLRRALTALRCPRPLAEVLAVTAAATVATAPLLALHFEQVSVVSLGANLLAAPAVAPLMWLGMLAAALAQVSAALAGAVGWLCAPFVAFVAWIAQLAAAPAWAATTLRLGAGTAVAGYALAAAATLAWRPARRRLAGRLSRAAVPRALAARLPRALGARGLLVAAVPAVALALALGGGGPPGPAAGELVVSFLDVGQGDATLLQRDGAAVLVDTGPPDGPILRRLAEAGVERLDVLVLTHAQADHEGAAPDVLRRIPTRLVLNGGAGWPSPVQRELPRLGPRMVAARAGLRLEVGGMAFEVLAPPAGLPQVGDPNDQATVALVRAGEFDLLLPADAESGVTARLDLGPVEALKVAHHGSEDPGLPALLERLRPAVAAIEVGRGNDYGHPHPSTLQALAGVPHVVRTDRDGTVRLHVRDGSMWLGD